MSSDSNKCTRSTVDTDTYHQGATSPGRVKRTNIDSSILKRSQECCRQTFHNPDLPLMALTIPIETLSNMKVLFKVGLPAGTFAFDMVPGNASDVAGAQLEGGMKLHLSAFHDSTGVTLTLSTSGQSSGRSNEESLEAVFDCNSPPLSGFPDQSFDYGTSHSAPDSASEPDPSNNLDFMSYPQSIPTMPSSEHLDLVLQNLRFDSPDYLFDLQDARGNFNDFLGNPLNLEYNRLHNYTPTVAHSTTG
ncbi:hypothetical protein B0H17DRAFT_330523 [Mycena rosella]|uniref:Uncharacterized protein n=1 Tax=Mycena rosella TaxID=1033263 RepID=A0AAD7G587_MYCRO|nr:hypothetical protein B0H17DRAFT_330523 [Mycena rosella]